MYLRHIPKGVQGRLSSAIWSIPETNSVYLTFDDGPSIHSDALLSLLAKHEVKASFFLLGENLEKRPGFIKKLTNSGHFVGNHGYLHLDGWRTNTDVYLENVAKGYELTQSRFYRPPYGRMLPSQWKKVAKEHQIIMWDIMPGDFDEKTSSQKCVLNVSKHVQAGSIIVLHDNEKSWQKLKNCLEPIIVGLKKKGLHLEALSVSLVNKF